MFLVAELKTNNAEFIKYNETTCYNYLSFKYTWTKGNVANDVLCVRAYLEYKDTDGSIKTVYSDDMVKANISGIIN